VTEVLITGGAGFVGSNLGIALAERHPEWSVTALDNLYRRGSELNLERLAGAGVRFHEGDVRSQSDLAAVPAPDLLVECSAEPSVMSGVDGDNSYLVHTNLTGAYNCLELARRSGSYFLFLSTSRVYPLATLRAARLDEGEERYDFAAEQELAGLSAEGVSEDAPLTGARTLYGTTKLAAELLVAEYREAYGLRACVDRCGVIAGPLQMGKVDQGVFTHWVLSHHFGLPLSYIGYGGTGKQVRDLLHVADLVDLIELQLLDPEAWDGRTVNVGGGRERSLSLLETTRLCRELTGREVEVGSDPRTRPGDVPIYVSDCTSLYETTDWRPRRSAEETLRDIAAWVAADEERLAAGLGLQSGGRR
jgi:CDP-paratose 2-epimerase